MLAWPWQIAGVLGKKKEVRSKLLREENQAYTEKTSTISNLEEGALQAVHVKHSITFRSNGLFTPSPVILNPGIHAVSSLVSMDGILFWHVAVWKKMCSHDTGVDCSCLMFATSSSQRSPTHVCDAASLAALVFHILGWCLKCSSIWHRSADEMC